MLQTNQVKAALKAGQIVTGPIVAETRTVGMIKKFKLAGHDFLFLDMEHAMVDWETMVNLVQGALLTRDPSVIETPFHRLLPDAWVLPARLLATLAAIIARRPSSPARVR